MQQFRCDLNEEIDMKTDMHKHRTLAVFAASNKRLLKKFVLVVEKYAGSHDDWIDILAIQPFTEHQDVHLIELPPEGEMK